MKYIILVALTLNLLNTYCQTSDEILSLLVRNNLITQAEADSLKLAENKKPKKSFLVESARQMQLSGYSQIRYQVFQESSRKDGFDVRRARLDLRGNVSPRFNYRLQADLAGSLKILDAYAEIKIAHFLSITIGQFRIPFSLENLTPVNKLEVIDFSQAVDALAARGRDVIGNHNGRDIGIQAGGTLLKNEAGPVLEYRLGIFNGSGVNIADTANSAKDFSGRLILTPIKGFSLGLSYYDGWGKAIKPAAEFAGRSQERDRYGFDASYTSKLLSLKAEYIHGKDGNFERAGWYAMAGYYIIPSKLQAVIKYDTYDPETGTDDNNSTWYSGGVNLNFNSWSRIQAFYTIRQEEGTTVDNNYFVIQYQIGF